MRQRSTYHLRSMNKRLKRPPTKTILLQESKILSRVYLWVKSMPILRGISICSSSFLLSFVHKCAKFPPRWNFPQTNSAEQCSPLFWESVSWELEIAECGWKSSHISRQIIITKFLHFVVRDRQCSFFVWDKIRRSRKKLSASLNNMRGVESGKFPCFGSTT